MPKHYDEEIPWILTDPDTGQYGRRLSVYRYEFKENEKDAAVVDLELYTWKEICDACEGYYENMDELFKNYGEHSSWIIAECLFETDFIKTE